jgi:hypothetical protein
MVVEDQLDCPLGWIGCVEQLEELDELPAAVTISDQGMNLAGEQILVLVLNASDGSCRSAVSSCCR